ncbi:MAG TPA: phosphomannomutase/phosphoglucomutase [Candidatus Saccharimonadales bacterium]|nr:phosphomannomutase/phosphoglucomutase [Candidatus Saccharimonadales bacterium]
MNDIDPKIFKAYDIRGIYPEQLNETNIVPIIRAIYKFFYDSLGKEQPTIVLAYDMRLSGPQLFEAAKKTLVEMGAKVIDAGQLSTPSFYFTVFHYAYDCGIQITASHNPKEWNGMKFVRYSPQGLIKIGKSTGMDNIRDMSIKGVDFTPTTQGSITPQEHILTDEVENALTLFNHPEIKKFKIVADPANAMGSQYIGAIFEKVPADLIKMNFELDGSFPVHQPDPLNFDNLRDLQKKVLEEKADFGLAPDGDGDRLYFIDEKGQVIPATIITALVARQMLKENPGATILVDIRYIMGTKKIVEEFGGKVVITRVGHAFITEKLNETGGVFAGESSGHFYYKANGNAESQLATIICVLKVLTEEGKTLSEIADELRRSHESGEVNFHVSNAPEILDALKEKYSDGELETLDGVSISYPTWRFNVRTSNTEPLLRLNVEGFDESEMQTKFGELQTFIKGLAKE